MLVGDGLNYGDIIELLLPVEDSIQRAINPTIYIKDNSFITGLLAQPKIVIKGVINDFGKFIKDQ